MSELKATTIYDAYWKANSVGEGTGILVYLKSEADKVIAEKDNELRHNKYKRCLAMAKWCDERIARIEKDYAFWRHGKDYAQNFYKKWRKRWRELAEKFKENV